MQSNITNLLETPPPLQPNNGYMPPNAPCYFCTAVAHDMRSPLTTINLAVEVLMSVMTNEAYRTYLAMILRASASINLQITELLKHQHPALIHVCKYSLHDLLDEVLAQAADRLELKKIIVNKCYAKKGAIKAIDPVATKMALMNIVVNAIDAMSVRGRLKLTTLYIDRVYTILIEDDGCGISPENLSKIFLPFYTSKTNGLGIGLAATQAIFTLNNISVGAESKEGSGTKFILSFPK